MKVALLQYAASQDKAYNLEKAVELSQKALSKGAEFILLPEVFNFRGDSRNKAVLASAAEKIPGPSTEIFKNLATKHKSFFLLGSIIEKDAPHVYNTSVLIDALGNISAKYRKIHLFNARIGDKIIRESDCFRSGRKLMTAQVGKFKIGFSVCYDLRFPELYRQYGRKGVNLLTVPSCFTRKTGEAHWEALLRARAIENLAYVLAPNQVGVDSRGIQAHGHSMIISPWGKVIAAGSGEDEEIVLGQLDYEEVSKAREMLPGVIK